jgi:glycosyltransferase involved in cell wall biosynthesis
LSPTWLDRRGRPMVRRSVTSPDRTPTSDSSRHCRNVSDPTVSIVVPVYNRPDYLRVAVASVLRQTCADWEMILADDGSSEETCAYLRSLDDPRISVLWLGHTGVPAAVRNAAIRRARGRYIAFLDSDDLWEPTKLAAQLEAMRASPGCRWSYTAPGLIDPEGRRLSRDGHAPWIGYTADIVERLLRHQAQVATPAVMVERSLIAEVGGFDEQQRFAEDHDLWIRLALANTVVAVPELLTVVRIGKRVSIGLDRIAAYEGWVRLYARLATSLPVRRWRALARRRYLERIVVLARLYAEAGRTRKAWAALARGARAGWWRPIWCWRAARAAGRIAVVSRPPEPAL